MPVDIGSILIGLAATSVALATPLTFAAVGEIFAERSGVLNLGIEGMMLLGAFMSFFVSLLTGNAWLGVLAGAASGGLLALVKAFFSVTIGSDQTVNGLGIWLLGTGLSIFLSRQLLQNSTVPPTVDGFHTLNIPVLANIPVLGPVIFQQNILVYLLFPTVAVAAFVLYKTTIGLKIRAVGEDPEAADAAGINVHKVRYACVIFGGMMAGVAGAYMSLAQLQTFVQGMTSGRGWMAFVIVILGGWNPVAALGAGIFFGATQAVSIQVAVNSSSVPFYFISMIPYIATVLGMIAAFKIAKVKGPAAMGIPYKRGKK